VNKTAASAAQSATCILLHAYSRTTANFQLPENKQKLHTAFEQTGITIFLVSIKNRLRTIEAEIP